MKILIITLTLSEKCGLGRFSLGLIQELAKRNELIIYTAREDRKLSFFCPNCRVFYLFPSERNIYRIMRPWLFLKYLLIILSKTRKVDLIHSFMDFPYSFLGCVISLLSRRPFVASGIGTYSIAPFYSRLWSGFLKWTYHHANKVICISNFTKGEILKRVSIKNCEVINPGINLEKFSIKGIKNKEINEIGDINHKIVLSVGMLKYRKGFHVSLKAMAMVRDKYPGLKYYIVGRQSNQNYFKELKKIVKDYNLEDVVVFLENISDKELKKLYRQIDLFLLTPVYTEGNFEGFGLVYLEAGVYSKPAVGSLGSGAEDAVIHGKTGLLVPQNNIEATAEAILKVLDHPELAEKFGEQGREFAWEHGWDKVVKKYVEIYKEIINKKNVKKIHFTSKTEIVF